MKNDLNDIIARRNKKLAAANKPAHRRATKVTITQLNEALGPAPRYVVDAVTRAMAIGRSDR